MTEPAAVNEIIARPAPWHRIKLLAVAALFIGFGLWCVRDGYYKWPAENEQAKREQKSLPHDGLGIQLNRGLGVALPIAGLGLLGRVILRSRGQYRLVGNTLHAPGHDPIALDEVVSHKIDKRRWDKKGIAEIEYELPGRPPETLVLDDFYYDRKATDQIFEHIEKTARQMAGAPADEDDDEDDEEDDR